MDPKASLRQAILTGDAPLALASAQQAIEDGTAPVDLVSDAIAPAMAEVGALFEAGEYYVPELLVAARATKGVFEWIRPRLAQQEATPAGKVVLGSVQGDLHDIGKNLVGAMLEGVGFEVIDLGVNVAPERFVSAAQERGARLVGLSALLTTTMPAMKSTMEAFVTSGTRNQVKVMVGGAPVTQTFADQIGADGYAAQALAAVGLARRLAQTP